MLESLYNRNSTPFNSKMIVNRYNIEKNLTFFVLERAARYLFPFLKSSIARRSHIVKLLEVAYNTGITCDGGCS